MGKIGRFISRWRKLSGKGKVLFLKSVICLTLIKFGLTMLPFSVFRDVFRWFTSTNQSEEICQQDIDLTVWAVDTAANLLPMEVLCLPRALATKYLLRKMPALTLEIGVEINPAKQFEAHAWVESNGNIIIGNWPESVSYQRLWVWK